MFGGVSLRLTDEQQKLVSDNHNLIYGFLNKHHLNLEDYYDVAAVGLCRAAIAYDPCTNFSFSTLAYKAMYNEFLRTFRSVKSNPDPATVSLNDSAYKESTSASDYFSLVEDMRNDLRSIDCKMDLAGKLRYLNYPELYLLNVLLLGGQQQDAAVSLGLTKSGVSALCHRMRDKFRGKGLYKKVQDSDERRMLLSNVTELIYAY